MAAVRGGGFRVVKRKIAPKMILSRHERTHLYFVTRKTGLRRKVHGEKCNGKSAVQKICDKLA
jgi:hypothetical protein